MKQRTLPFPFVVCRTVRLDSSLIGKRKRGRTLALMLKKEKEEEEKEENYSFVVNFIINGEEGRIILIYFN